MRTDITMIALVLVIAAVGAAACSRNGTSGTTAGGGSGPAAAPAAPELSGGSLRDALVLGQKTGRNVVFEYYDEGCPYCRQMTKDALSDEGVKAALRAVVHVRMTKGKDADSFVQRFGGQVTPTFVAMRPDGAILGQPLSGVVKAADFARYLAWAKTGDGPMPGVSGAGG